MTNSTRHQRLAGHAHVRIYDVLFPIPKTVIRLSVFGFLLISLLSVSCGKRRPPQPPIERIPQRTEALSGFQRGSQIILSWPAPRRNAADSSVQSIRRVDVYRLAEKVTAPLPLTEEEFGARSTLVGSVEYQDIRLGLDVLKYTDTLQLAGEPVRLRYAVRYVNASGQRAAFSNFLLIEPSARIAQPPSNLEAKTTEPGIVVTWQAPASNIDGTTPINVLGYNLYRTAASAADVEPAPINSALISETNYTDKTFRFGDQYTYFVRAVSLGSGGNQVESLDSNNFNVSAKDIYAPSAPSSITIAAAPGRLSLFFPANTESDVVGYNVYRSLDPELSKDKWSKLNGELLTRTTYQDEKVEPGKKYYYYLTAVDSSGNVSAPSEVVSESVP